MQQATIIKIAPPTAGAAVPQAAARNTFVINLCSSTTPVSLARPDHAGLKRFTFFVSRRLEEGRERFRLHMGYFESQQAAEQLLDIVREIYPGAWAGLAPGQRLRAGATASAAPAEHPTPTPAMPARAPERTEPRRAEAVKEPSQIKTAPPVLTAKPVEMQRSALSDSGLVAACS